jgi:alpha-L-fucosidase
VRGDGTIDDQEIAFLEGFGKWMKTNGEAIYNTRPWKTFGEGPAKAAGGMFNEGKMKYGPEDIRFTAAKDGTLYVFVMAKPTADIVVKSLGGEKIASVKMLGSDETIKFDQADGALKIQKPASFPDEDVVVFKATFN